MGADGFASPVVLNDLVHALDDCRLAGSIVEFLT
jgi:hypothetical protein